MHEMELTKNQAEKFLREHLGNVEDALTALINV